MISRVATFAISEQMINAALRAQSTMANEQVQEASGQVSSDFAGVATASQQVLDLQVSVTRSQSYIDSATSADSKVQVMYSTMTSITNLYTQLRSTLTEASSAGATTNATSLSDSAQQMMQELSSLLNTQYSGQYLFGGAKTTNPPVDTSSAAYPAATSPSSPETSYYLGDDQIASARVGESDSVSYGVTADNPAFEQGMRALNLVANNSGSAAALSEAMDLVNNALDATAAVQSHLSIASSALQNASASQSDFQNFAKSLGSNLTSVDVAAVTAQLSTYQAQLEASYSAIAKIQSLNLASYIH